MSDHVKTRLFVAGLFLSILFAVGGAAHLVVRTETRQAEAARLAGEAAAKGGVPAEANPYGHDPRLAPWWLEGWRQGRRRQ